MILIFMTIRKIEGEKIKYGLKSRKKLYKKEIFMRMFIYHHVYYGILDLFYK